jgi:hypothetical protein
MVLIPFRAAEVSISRNKVERPRSVGVSQSDGLANANAIISYSKRRGKPDKA